MPGPRPDAWIDGCAAAHRRLEAALAVIDDAIARRPSALPGWTVGHLLTHLARNADSHLGMIDAIAAGGIADQYPGGAAQRERDIAAGAGRSAADLAADVVASHHRLEAAWAALTEDAWAVGLGRRAAGPAPAPALVALRWREAELHAVDLALDDRGGPGWSDLSDGYVDLEWGLTLAGLDARLADGVAVLLSPGDRPSRLAGRGPSPVVVRDDVRSTLRWLTGRWERPDRPALSPWP